MIANERPLAKNRWEGIYTWISPLQKYLSPEDMGNTEIIAHQKKMKRRRKLFQKFVSYRLGNLRSLLDVEGKKIGIKY